MIIAYADPAISRIADLFLLKLIEFFTLSNLAPSIVINIIFFFKILMIIFNHTFKNDSIVYPVD